LKNPFLKNLNETIFNRINDAPSRGEHRNGAKPCANWAEPHTIFFGNSGNSND